MCLIGTSFEDIVMSCLNAGKSAILKVKNKIGISRWSGVAKPPWESGFWGNVVWVSCENPQTGAICEIKRKMRTDVRRSYK